MWDKATLDERPEKMKFKGSLILLAAFPLLLFNVVYFSIWGNMSASRWICWGAIHLAFALFVAAAHSIKAMGDDGPIHAYPKMASAYSLLSITVIAGIILTIWNPKTWQIPAVILAILAFMDLFTYIALMSAEEATIKSEKRDARHKFFIQSCAERLEEARKSQADIALRKQIEKACDAIRGAQVTSVPAVAEIEARIESLVSKLCGEAEAGSSKAASTASEIVAAVRKRDMEIRLSR